MGYQHLEVEVEGRVGTLWLNRPLKRNAISEDMWADIPAAMTDLNEDATVRAVVLAARGPAFSVGIDVNLLASLQPTGASSADSNKKLYELIVRLQKTATCLARSPKPVIAAVHGYCLGAGLDFIVACDIRLASSDAIFSIRETKMGLVADIGSLQRLPAIVGQGATAEMAFTGGDFDAKWAKERGLVNDVFEDAETVVRAAQSIASDIAANSPLATQGVKEVLAAADGRTVDEALDYVALWNSSRLMSNDLIESLAAFMEKRDPDYSGT